MFILNNKQLPVMFNDSDVNCTDNNVIYIGADISKKDNLELIQQIKKIDNIKISFFEFDGDFSKLKNFKIIEDFPIFNIKELNNKKHLTPILGKENYEKQFIIGYICE